jgi:GMP synthase (glutamine-hydrolysing)
VVGSSHIIKVDAKDQFYRALKGVKDPEEKRKIIGVSFSKSLNKKKKNTTTRHFLLKAPFTQM